MSKFQYQWGTSDVITSHSQAFYLVMFKIRMGFTVLIDTSTAEEVVQTGAASRSDM